MYLDFATVGGSKNMILRKRLKQAFSAAIGPIARASNQLVTLCLTLVAMRYLTPAEFGVFALAVLATTVIRTLLYSGSYEFFLRTKEPNSTSSEVLLFNVAVCMTCCFVTMSACGVALNYGYDNSVIITLIILLPSNFISAFGAWQEAHLLRSGRITSYYMTTVAAEGLSMIGAVAMFLLGYGLTSLIAQIYIRNTLLSLFYLCISRPFLSDRASFGRLKELFHWSLPVYGSTSLGLVSNYSADLLLGLLLSPAATGVYRASNRLVTAVADIFNQPTRLASMTITSKAVANGLRSETQWVYVFTVAATIGWSGLAGLAVTAGQLVPAVLGQQWAAAAPVVSILCVARAFSLFDSAMSPALVAHSRQHALFRVQLVTTAALFIMMFVFARLGLQFAALAIVVAALLKSYMTLRLTARNLVGSGRTLRQNALIVLVPSIAVACTAAAVSSATQGALDVYTAAAATIASGAAVWMLCMVVLRHRITGVLKSIRELK